MPAFDQQASYPRFSNGEVHDWYRLVHGYTDDLVAGILDELQVDRRRKVLDPFCGAGTTLVECMKRGIASVGIDANPASFFAARVKTTWGIDPDALLGFAGIAEARFSDFAADSTRLKLDKTYCYIDSAGMLERGWINPGPLARTIAIKLSIQSLEIPSSYKRALFLALIAEVVRGASNVKFGPQLYCGPSRERRNVMKGFLHRVSRMADDLTIARRGEKAATSVLLGDSRGCALLARKYNLGKFGAVITSPPYPNEHDYTRNSRLELAFLNHLDNVESVRTIKQAMIRSHTKGIYKADTDARLISGHPEIEWLANKIDRRARGKTDGFARLYSRVLREYFGGMKRHLADLHKILSPNAMLAYVIGDQASYFQVHIPTAKILASLARDVGYEFMGIRRWRGRTATATSTTISENILYLRRA